MRDDGTNPGQGPAPNVDALVREVLVRVADRWTLLVLEALAGERELRFARLRERLDGVSQKMLTKTLRALERDGLVTRRVHATVPPRVDYKLTPLGEGLGASLCGLWTWAEAHVDEIERARRAFDEAGDADAAG
ncbi:MAG TPA: helix-turn-helix domain-containing protein [Minicystis sp.]|nr:helix-turn-helix domain-containing protein [Minicystis sp.]